MGRFARVPDADERNDQQSFLIPNYRLRTGSMLDRARLVKMMQRAYRDLGATGGDHLAETVQRHFSDQSRLWWVEQQDAPPPSGLPGIAKPEPLGCLWLSEAIDQWTGQAQAYVFLVYVAPEHRRQGIGTALLRHAQQWAKNQGYGAIGLQVFESNPAAVKLYESLGYRPRAIWMTLEF